MAHADEADALRLALDDAGLRGGVLEALAFSASRETFARGDLVVGRGAAASAVWVLVRGLLESRGEASFQIEPPALIGAGAALAARAHDADLVALQDASMLRIDVAQLERLAAAEPALAVALARLAARESGTAPGGSF